ncbi:MAG: hypothetical protein ACXADH_15990 [Candidatus Kariarchaeaceae archaeon]|jgi:uncharacterized protein YcgL (UPF0745 family)
MSDMRESLFLDINTRDRLSKAMSEVECPPGFPQLAWKDLNMGNRKIVGVDMFEKICNTVGRKRVYQAMGWSTDDMP